MADILNEAGQKVAIIGEDGNVHNMANVVIGSVRQNNEVYNNTGSVIGSFDAKGYVYKGGSHIGTVHPDGRVYDYENHEVGKVVGDHIESGGAALLLLVR